MSPRLARACWLYTVGTALGCGLAVQDDATCLAVLLAHQRIVREYALLRRQLTPLERWHLQGHALREDAAAR